jgi:hypothetical protein
MAVLLATEVEEMIEVGWSNPRKVEAPTVREAGVMIQAVVNDVCSSAERQTEALAVCLLFDFEFVRVRLRERSLWGIAVGNLP